MINKIKQIYHIIIIS